MVEIQKYLKINEFEIFERLPEEAEWRKTHLESIFSFEISEDEIIPETTEQVIPEYKASGTIYVIADSGQFQICDQSTDPMQEEVEPDWTTASVKEFGACSDFVVALGVVKDGEFEIPFSIHTDNPEINTEEWEHVVEFPLESSSGVVEFMIGESIVLPIGFYLLRWYVRTTNGTDEYMLQFIKSEEPAVRKIIKQQNSYF